jgi:hypothetical protein
MRGTRLLAALCASLLLVAAGCGSSATNSYRSKVASVQKKYESQLTALTAKVTNDLETNQAAGVADLNQLSAVVNKFADEVAAIPAPAGRQALADQLVKAYRTLAKAATDLGVAVKNHDQAALTTALGEFSSATTSESNAVTAFNSAN